LGEVGCITISSDEMRLGVSLISSSGVDEGSYGLVGLYFTLGWVLQDLLIPADLLRVEP
jgi:hypothetical protein